MSLSTRCAGIGSAGIGVAPIRSSCVGVGARIQTVCSETSLDGHEGYIGEPRVHRVRTFVEDEGVAQGERACFRLSTHAIRRAHRQLHGAIHRCALGAGVHRRHDGRIADHGRRGFRVRVRRAVVRRRGVPPSRRVDPRPAAVGRRSSPLGARRVVRATRLRNNGCG